jgi:hypothetical protein
MDNVAVFTWRGELPSDDEIGADPATRYSNDFGEQWAYQAAQPVANQILRSIRQLGYATDGDTADFNELYWYFVVKIGQFDYCIIVQCVPRVDRNDSFAIEPSRQRGCLAALFFPRRTDSTLSAAKELINRVLRSHPLVADVSWTEDAFSE